MNYSESYSNYAAAAGASSLLMSISSGLRGQATELLKQLQSPEARKDPNLAQAISQQYTAATNNAVALGSAAFSNTIDLTKVGIQDIRKSGTLLA
jgi:hypothetical protein